MKQTDLIASVLSDAEKSAVQTVVDNKLTCGALKKVLLASLYFNGTLRKGEDPDPTLNAALSLAFSNEKKSNEELGQDLRGLAEGVRLLELGFQQLEKYKSSGTPPKQEPNEAR